MNKKVIIVLAFMSLLASCKKQPVIKYHWVTGKNSINLISRIERSTIKDTTILSYFSSIDTLNYYILNNNKDSYIIGSYEEGPLRQFKDTTITLGGKVLTVAKFVQDEEVVDGAVIHYYSPQLGVFAIHSDTWPGLQYLQSTDSILNKQVKALIKATVPEFYIRRMLKAELEKQ